MKSWMATEKLVQSRIINNGTNHRDSACQDEEFADTVGQVFCFVSYENRLVRSNWRR